MKTWRFTVIGQPVEPIKITKNFVQMFNIVRGKKLFEPEEYQNILLSVEKHTKIHGM